MLSKYLHPFLFYRLPPFPPIVRGRDALGRVNSVTINGSVASSYHDSLGRMGSVTNPLGTSTFGYTGNSRLLRSITTPSRPSVTFDYHDLNNDLRLKEIWNKTSAGATLSKFNYGYDQNTVSVTRSAV